jgi:hypothetical protein
MKEQMEQWEKAGERKLMWQFSGVCIAGSLAVLALSFLFRRLGWGSVPRGDLTLVWMIGGLLGVPAAYHRGVRDALSRRSQTR